MKKEYNNPQQNSEKRKAVVAVLINADSKKLLLRRDNDDGYTQFIRGGVEDNESEEVALSREISEETGIQNIKIISKIAEPFVVHQFMDHKNTWRSTECHAYLVEYNLENQTVRNLSENEFGDYDLVEVDLTTDFANNFKTEDYVIDLFEETKRYLTNQPID